MLADRGYISPNALQVPGPLHLLNTVIATALSETAWWQDFQKTMKAVAQWVSPRGLRLRLRFLLKRARKMRVGGPANIDHCLRLVAKKPNAFADWRWGTLEEVCRQLGRYRGLLQWLVVRHDGDLRSLFGPTAHEIKDVILDPDFWGTMEMLLSTLGPVFGILHWIRGCSCHAWVLAEGGKPPPCIWKGCRGPELASKIEEATGALLGNMATAVPERATVADRCLWLGPETAALLWAKFIWVRDLPFFVWQRWN